MKKLLIIILILLGCLMGNKKRYILGGNVQGGTSLYGAAQKLWNDRYHEVGLAGPAETGKTLGALKKLDALLWKYAGSRALMARKVYADIKESAIVTYVDKVIGAWDKKKKKFDHTLTPIKRIGGEAPSKFVYPNGSVIVVCGLDKASKALSAEYDFIYINQAEELDVRDYETLTTRCTGRAGNAPYSQIFFDCNPAHPTHWILERCQVGSLRLYQSVHEDNPTLFDPITGNITKQGERSLGILDKLTGVRKERLRFGRWVQAEGAVYETWDPSIHVIDRFKIPVSWRRIRVVDWGYTNPLVCQWWAIDGDKNMYRYREIYKTKRTVPKHAKVIKYFSKGEKIEQTITDHDPDNEQIFEDAGIPNIQAEKDIESGIQAVMDRLEKQPPHDKPKIFYLRDSLCEGRDPLLLDKHQPTCTEEEYPNYRYPRDKDGKVRKEVPIAEDDHGLDTTRYGVKYIDGHKPIRISSRKRSKVRRVTADVDMMR